MTDTYLYAGWVPTVTGNLSFTVVGVTNHPEPSDSVNIEIDTKRYILAAQRRYLGDVVLPWPFGRPTRERVGEWFGLAGSLKFFLHARAVTPQGDPRSCLQGRVVIALDSDVFRRRLKPRFDEVRDQMRIYARDPDNGHVNDVVSGHDGLGEFLDDSTVIVPFCLYRNGFCYIGRPRVGQFGADGQGPHEIDDESARQVAAQAFYFIKDLTHRHVHHPGSTDTVCDLYEIEGDEDWRALTLYGLYRKIIRLKRYQPDTAYDLADGLLAYAESFRKLWESDEVIDRYSPSPAEKIPTYHVEESRQSLGAANRLHEKVSDENYRAEFRTVNVLILGLIVVSTTAAISGLMDAPSTSNVEVHPDLLAFRQKILADPYMVTAVLLLVLLVLRPPPFTARLKQQIVNPVVILLSPVASNRALGAGVFLFGAGLIALALELGFNLFSVLPLP
jgi:hypothetical protein